MNLKIVTYGINVQKTLNTPNKCFYLAHFIVGDVPPYKRVALREGAPRVFPNLV
jgi:hypothetical protein